MGEGTSLDPPEVPGRTRGSESGVKSWDKTRLKQECHPKSDWDGNWA
jgi:hypothetical protein